MTNNEIKFYEKLKHKKYREAEKLFIIEGVHLIEECIKSKYYKDNLKKIIIRDDFDNKDLLKKLDKFPVAIIKAKQFKNISDTINSPGIAGIIEIPKINFDVNINIDESSIIVALENINDPGNLGTILRTCFWFGINKVLISENSVDIYNPKVIRASQGALFNLMIKDELNFEVELNNLQSSGFDTYLTTLDSKNYLSDLNFQKGKKIIFIFGNEANGISEKLKSMINFKDVKIKSLSDSESLNLATSVGIVLYEATKQIADNKG